MSSSASAYSQELVQKMTTPSRKMSMCAVKIAGGDSGGGGGGGGGGYGMSLDTRSQMCSVWGDKVPLVRYELHGWSCMAVSAQYLVLGNYEGYISLFEHPKQQPHERPYTIAPLKDAPHSVVHLAFSKDESHLLIIRKSRQAHVLRVADMTLSDLPTFAPVRFNHTAFCIYPKNVAACWSPDNRHILLVYNSKPLMHHIGIGAASWDNVVPEESYGHSYGLHMLGLCAWSPRGDTYALVSVGSVLGAWVYLYGGDKHHLKLTIHLPSRHQMTVTGLVYSSDGSLLAVSTPEEPFIHFFSPATGTLVFNYTPPPYFANKALGYRIGGGLPHIHIRDEYFHIAVNYTCYTHTLTPRWKRTLLQMLLLKGTGTGTGRGRRLPHELWHLIACDFRDALQVSIPASSCSPITIYKTY
jgi:hypothetical protein